MQLLNYKQQGSGPNVILIHGLFGSLENLNMIAQKLSENYTVTSVDVRNHGRSFHENSMSYQELSQDIVNIMEHLSIDKAHLLGHSMGGKIAMFCALVFPHKVDKLIVADIAPVEYKPHHNLLIEGLKSIDLTLIESRRDADKQLAKYVDEVGVRQFLLKNLSTIEGKFTFKCNIDFISNCYTQLMPGFDNTNSFTGETLFIKGAKSDYILPEYKAQIMPLFPNCNLKIIQDTGHWLHGEKPVIFNNIVEKFLA